MHVQIHTRHIYVSLNFGHCIFLSFTYFWGGCCLPPIDVYMLLWHGSDIIGTRNGWILWLRDQLHGWDEWNLSTLVFKVKVLVEEGLVHESGTPGHVVARSVNFSWQ